MAKRKSSMPTVETPISRGSFKRVFSTSDSTQLYLNFPSLDTGDLSIDELYGEIELHNVFNKVGIAPKIYAVVINDKQITVDDYLENYKDMEIPSKFGLYVERYPCGKNEICKNFITASGLDAARFFGEIFILLRTTIELGYYNTDIKLENMCYKLGKFFWIDCDPKFFKKCDESSSKYYYNYMLIQLFREVRSYYPDISIDVMGIPINEIYDTLVYLFDHGDHDNEYDALYKLAQYSGIDLKGNDPSRFLPQLFSESRGFTPPKKSGGLIFKTLMAAGLVAGASFVCLLGGRKSKKHKSKKLKSKKNYKIHKHSSGLYR